MPGLPACWKQSASREHIRGFLTHSATTFLSSLGASYEERVEDVVFQPQKALAVPTMPQRWDGYLQSYSSTNTTTPVQHLPPKPALQPPSHTSSPCLHNSLRSPQHCGAAKAPEGRTGHPWEDKHESPQSSHCCQSFAPQAHPPALHRAAPLAAERRMEKGSEWFSTTASCWGQTLGRAGGSATPMCPGGKSRQKREERVSRTQSQPGEGRLPT